MVALGSFASSWLHLFYHSIFFLVKEYIVTVHMKQGIYIARVKKSCHNTCEVVHILSPYTQGLAFILEGHVLVINTICPIMCTPNCHMSLWYIHINPFPDTTNIVLYSLGILLCGMWNMHISVFPALYGLS